MIYLMSDSKLLKIGYSSNLNNRLSGLKTGNPLITIVSFKAGSRIDEKNLHEQCKEWHVDKEWYQDNIEVRKKFEEYDPFSSDEINSFKNELSKALLHIDKEKNYHYLDKPIFRYFKEKVINIKDVPEEYSKMLKYLEETEAYCNALYCIKYTRKEGLMYIKPEYKVSRDIYWHISSNDLDFIINRIKQKINKYEELQKRTNELKIDLSNVKTDYVRSILKSKLAYNLEDLNAFKKEIQECTDFMEDILSRLK